MHDRHAVQAIPIASRIWHQPSAACGRMRRNSQEPTALPMASPEQEDREDDGENVNRRQQQHAEQARPDHFGARAVAPESAMVKINRPKSPCPGFNGSRLPCISASENDFDPTRAGSEAGRMAKMARSPVPAEAGERQAVLGPLVFADLVNQFGRSASAFHVDSGLSFLGGKIGRGVEKFTLSSTIRPWSALNLRSAPFDAEGSPTKANKIVSNGILRTYLHNNATTAKKYGT